MTGESNFTSMVTLEGKLGSAVFSADGNRTYRYLLTRHVSPAAPGDELGRLATFVLLNPSTADHGCNDQTVRFCIRNAESWAYDMLHVVNLNPFRSRNREKMKAHPLPDCVAEANAAQVVADALRSQRVVVAWGKLERLENVPEALRTVEALRNSGVPTWALGLNQDGTP